MRRLLSAFAAGSMLVSPQAVMAKTQAAPRPDILLIVLDDVGFSDIGAYGSEIRTPNIDALAAGGLRFNRFDTRAVCSATRAALLTGRNNQTVGMESLASDRKVADPANRTPDRGELVSNAQTMAQALGSSGYSTYAFGKWHLAPEYDAPPAGKQASWPLQRGFQNYYGFLGGWTDQYRPALIEGNAPIPAPQRPGYHLTVDLVDHAISALSAKPKGKPAFVYLALGAAHAPLQVPKSYIDSYAGVYERGWDALRKERLARQIRLGVVPPGTRLAPRNAGDPAWDSLTDQQRRVYARFMATYAGFMTHTDEQIGRLIGALRKSGRLKNTLVVLMSDNGPASEAHGDGEFRRPYGDNTSLADMDAHLDELGGPTTQPHYQRPWAMLGATPFPRYKLWPYAGGIRAPLIVNWPGHLSGAGTVRHQRIDAIDLAPTLLAAAGTRFAASVNGVPQLPVAGRPMNAVFRSAKAPGRQVQFFGLYGNRAITSGRWVASAVKPCSAPIDKAHWSLYDTASDFSESRDVSALHPDVLQSLQQTWQKEVDKWVGAPLAATFAKCNYLRFTDAYPPRD